MSVNEQGITLTLVALLLGVAVYFSWRQIKTLRGLNAPDVLGADDRRYLRKQAVRRLCCSVLLVTFAGMLIGWLVLESHYRPLREEIKAAELIDPPAKMTQEQKDYARLIAFYWIAALMVLLVLFATAGMDFWSTARYGISQHRKLQADHRAALEKTASSHPEDRNGFRKR